MQNTIILTANEIFQLAAIGPCVIIIIYLFFVTKDKYTIFIPVLYFSSILLSFLLPILTIFPEFDIFYLRTAIMFNEYIEPELAFLLILQFILRRPPPVLYWLIMFVPFIGGSSFIYLYIQQEDACFFTIACIPSKDLMSVYSAVMSAVIFLLLVPVLNRRVDKKKRGKEWREQYWLIVILIMYNLLIMGLDLYKLSSDMDVDKYNFIKTMFGVTFIYLVISSIFRVFNKSFKIQAISDVIFSPQDNAIIEKIDYIMENEKPFLELDFNRGILADKLGLTEPHLSRIINSHYKKSFSELMNINRISYAKDCLINGNKSITEISFDSGFKSITSFNRVFKDLVEMPPSLFRENNRIAKDKEENEEKLKEAEIADNKKNQEVDIGINKDIDNE